MGPSSDPRCHPCLPVTPSFSYFHGLIWFKSRLREKLASFWELILILKSRPLPNSFGALGSPNTQRGRAPNEDCYRSIMDNEGNNGNARGNGQKCWGGREQKTEGKAPLLHHAQIRTSPKNSILSSLKQRNLSHIATDFFFFFTVHFNIVRWLRGLAPVRHLWGICC